MPGSKPATVTTSPLSKLARKVLAEAAGAIVKDCVLDTNCVLVKSQKLRLAAVSVTINAVPPWENETVSANAEPRSVI